MHRGKRRCLDSSAVDGVPVERPLVVGVGNAGFPSNGPCGELPAPTSELNKAMKRALAGIQATGRSVITQSLDEFRTTMCCCACGSVTSAPTVTRRRRDRTTGEMVIANGPSRRLRCCTTCSSTGKLRDRDVQACDRPWAGTRAPLRGNFTKHLVAGCGRILWTSEARVSLPHSCATS
jgi:hypothetical protein